MNAVTRGSPINLSVVLKEPKSAALPVDDYLRIARLRMQHLVPWNVAPLPMMHSAIGTPSNRPLTPEERERSEHLAFRVLAVQMCQAENMSALQ
jgi:hypothetical protein